MTRTDDFPLVLKENISYGLRRNLWGRKAYGVAFAAFIALTSGALLVADLLGGGVVPASSAALPLAFSALALVVWGRDDHA